MALSVKGKEVMVNKQSVVKTCFLLIMLFCAGSSVTFSRENIRVNLDGTYLSRFVWRGEMWTDDPVFWHTATIRYGDLRSYNFFNVDLTDINSDRYECNEFDFILDYTFSLAILWRKLTLLILPDTNTLIANHLKTSLKE